ncbi:MAG: lipid-binding SYLF domain-containing protein [Halioglobus sp.]|jgi:lipid-binding SYLF domain-containing protein
MSRVVACALYNLRKFAMSVTLRALLVLSLSTLLGPLAWADSDAEAIASFRNAGESGTYFNNSHGYAIFPTIGKGGIGIGGAHGNGSVYVEGVKTGTSSMTQVTIGFQLGGQAFSQIIFFEDEHALTSFTSGNFEFSAQASAVAITAGASIEANTGGGTSAGISGGRNDATTSNHGGYRKGMAIFTIAKGGLMYEAALGGQKYNYKPL